MNKQFVRMSSEWKAVRSIFLLCFFLAGAAVSMAQSGQDTIKVLAIGNSFSEDAVEQYLYELAEEEGIPMVIGNLCIGGCPLECHVDNARENAPAYAYRKIGADGEKTERKDTRMETALGDEEWDYVSVQQASPLSGMYDTYEKSLPELVGYVRKHVGKHAVLTIHQTWAYASDSGHDGFKNYDSDQIKMYKAIVDAVNRSASLVKIRTIIPSGTAIQNARTSFVGDHLTRDGYHLDLNIGRYAAACTWLEILTGRSAVGNAYCPPNLSAERKEVAQKAAHAAVLWPDKVTDLSELCGGEREKQE